MKCICFSQSDLETFSRASHDFNPLHLSAEYAHKTPFSQPVVFGVLGGLYGLAQFPPQPEKSLTKLTLDFQGAMYVDIPYQVQLKERDRKSTVKLYDGRRLLLKLTAEFAAATPALKLARGNAVLVKPKNPTILMEGVTTEGHYAPANDEFEALLQQFALAERGLQEQHLVVLLWASYLVGMELPGRQALFSKLSLQFYNSIPDNVPNSAESMQSSIDAAPDAAPLNYTATVSTFDDRFSLLQAKAQLTVADQQLATAEIRAFIRPELPQINQAVQLPRSQALQGKVALVTGGSRGLGAAIAQALVWQGCTVLLNYRKSRQEAETLQTTVADASGQLELVQGDISDLTRCEAIKTDLLQTHGRLDFLVCNACPPILPLWIEANTIQRVNDYVSQSLSLMSVPMAAFLDLVDQQSGHVVVISSVVTTQTPPTEWPHYVSSKQAIEGITRVAALEYTQAHFLLVRPPKLLTAQTNTPIGRQGALLPEEIAAKIVQELGASSRAATDITGDNNLTLLDWSTQNL